MIAPPAFLRKFDVEIKYYPYLYPKNITTNTKEVSILMNFYILPFVFN